ncbi:MAG: hypothetical protein EXS09_14980 [Gemmataceae bacterium]|nr:hypothetical protein [Gemmataceae bacterium]
MDLRRILAAYPRHLADARWLALGNAGGFSGARIWRGTTFDGREFALKQYSPATTERQLARIHGWMKAALEQGLPFVPAVEPGRDGRTLALVDERCWDITTWMPGKADFHEDPTDDKLFAAIDALARIHAVWEKLVPAAEQPCPAILRRWQAVQDAQALLQNDRARMAPSTESLSLDIERAWSLVPRLVPRMEAALAPWRIRPVRVLPCIGDLWHDHVLYVGTRVSGTIDFAAAKFDAPEADMARLLGSLIPGERERLHRALNVYRAIRPLPNHELVEVLDVTGTFGAVVNWLMRFKSLPKEDVARVARRFEKLVVRLGEFE